MSVGVIFPILDGVFAANVNIHTPAFTVVFVVVRIPARIILDGNEMTSEQLLVFAGKLFDKLNDFVVK